MSRMTDVDWSVYAVLRNVKGKAYAEEYRHKRNKRNAEYGIDLRKPNDWTIVKGYDTGGVLVKRFIPGEMEVQGKRNFEEREWIEAPMLSYDCTGKPFSLWMEFFDVPGGTWVYHRIGLDV